MRPGNDGDTKRGEGDPASEGAAADHRPGYLFAGSSPPLGGKQGDEKKRGCCRREMKGEVASDYDGKIQ